MSQCRVGLSLPCLTGIDGPGTRNNLNKDFVWAALLWADAPLRYFWKRPSPSAKSTLWLFIERGKTSNRVHRTPARCCIVNGGRQRENRSHIVLPHLQQWFGTGV